jgi:hypothetical protein
VAFKSQVSNLAVKWNEKHRHKSQSQIANQEKWTFIHYNKETMETVPSMMLELRTSLALLGWLLLCFSHNQAVAVSSFSNDNDNDVVAAYNNGIASGEEECGIYIAPSTIPHAGFGMFAGKAYRPLDFVTPGDLAVPVVDLEWHTGYTEFVHVWDDYHWNAGTFPGMINEAGDHAGAVTGYSFGIFANSFYPLINLAIASDVSVDSAGLHRSRDPGAGAFTPYHNRRTYASKNIPAGYALIKRMHHVQPVSFRTFVWRLCGSTRLNFFHSFFFLPLL